MAGRECVERRVGISQQWLRLCLHEHLQAHTEFPAGSLELCRVFGDEQDGPAARHFLKLYCSISLITGFHTAKEWQQLTSASSSQRSLPYRAS